MPVPAACGDISIQGIEANDQVPGKGISEIWLWWWPVPSAVKLVGTWQLTGKSWMQLPVWLMHTEMVAKMDLLVAEGDITSWSVLLKQEDGENACPSRYASEIMEAKDLAQ